MLLKYFVSYYFQEKIWEQVSVVVFVFILSSKGANQLQILYIRTLGNIQGKFTIEAAVFKCLPSKFLWKFAEVLGQHLKSSLWKIMS